MSKWSNYANRRQDGLAPRRSVAKTRATLWFFARRLAFIYSIVVLLVTTGMSLASSDTPAQALTHAEPPPYTGGIRIHRINSSVTSAKLALWHQPRRPNGHVGPRNSSVVLFIHGATVSAGMSAGYRINGYSWMDDVAASGRDAWALDFLGYGRSDPYPQMRTGSAAAPLGGAEQLVADIERAVDYILADSGATRITIVATSRGAIPAGYYASKHPKKIERIVFNSPIVYRETTPAQVITSLFGSNARPQKPYYDISISQRLKMLSEDRPNNTEPQLEEDFVEHWPSHLAREYSSDTKNQIDAVIRVPGGFAQDIYDAWNGKYWRADQILVPVLIVRGDYDRVLTTAADAQWLYDNLSAVPSKRSVLIDKGTHAMLFEKKRFELYREVQLFLDADYGKLPSTGQHGRG